MEYRNKNQYSYYKKPSEQKYPSNDNVGKLKKNPPTAPAITEEEIHEILKKYKTCLYHKVLDQKEFLTEEDQKKVLLILESHYNIKSIFVARSEKSTLLNPTYCFHLLFSDGNIKPISIKYCFDNLQKKNIKEQLAQKKKLSQTAKRPEEYKFETIDVQKKHENLIDQLNNEWKKESKNNETGNFQKEKLEIALQQLEVYKKSVDSIKARKLSQQRINTLLQIEEERLALALPVYAKKFEIVSKIKSNKVTLISSETGSGKSTQIPQFIAEELLRDFLKWKPIVVTQPRKIAVKTLAERVCKEQRVNPNNLNSEIQCQVGSISPSRSKYLEIKYMLDRSLLDEFADDRELLSYGCVIVDEAHERNVNTDVLLGFLLELAMRRTDNFRLVVMTATMDDLLFEKYFKAQIYRIPGRIYPVTVKYRLVRDRTFALEAIESIIKTELFDFKRNLKPEYDGHILIFTSGLEDIRALYGKLLGWLNRKKYHIFQLHGKISYDQQQAIYEEYDPEARKIILATRIAESSITINKVRTVIDIGYDLQQIYDKSKKITKTEIRTITQSQATQRTGRAGRTCSGWSFRVYSEEEYADMQRFKESEILHINSDLVVLKLKQLGVKDVVNFNYLETPPVDALASSLNFMEEIGAFNEMKGLSTLGALMARLPTEPALSRIVIEGKRQDCFEEVIKIVAVMNFASGLFSKKMERDNQLQKTEFYDQNSDLLIFLKVYDGWLKNGDSWCEKNGIISKTLHLAKELHDEIDVVLKTHKSSIDEYLASHEKLKQQELHTRLIKCFLSSMYENICIFTKNARIGYMLLGRNMIVKLDESSTFSLQANYPKWILPSEFVQNESIAGLFLAKVVSELDIEMIEEMVPKSFLSRHALENLDKLESPIYKMKRIQDIPSRVLSVFMNRKDKKVVDFFDRFEQDAFFEYSSEFNFMEIWTLKDLQTIEDEVKNILDCLLDASAKESIEYKLIVDTRIVIEKGAEVKQVFLTGEFRHLVFSFLNITKDSLSAYLLTNQIPFISVNLKTSKDSIFVEGEVTTETPEDCEKFEKLLASMLKIKKTIRDAAQEEKILRYQVKMLFYVGNKTSSALFGFNNDEDKLKAIELADQFARILSVVPPFYQYKKSIRQFFITPAFQKPFVLVEGLDQEMEDNELEEAFHSVFDKAQIFPDYMHMIRNKLLSSEEDLTPEKWIETLKTQFASHLNTEDVILTFTRSEGKFKKEIFADFQNHDAFIAFKNETIRLKTPSIKGKRLQLKFLYRWEEQVHYKIFHCLVDQLCELQKTILMRTDWSVCLLYYHYQIEEARKDNLIRSKVSLIIEGDEMERVKWAVQETKILLQGKLVNEKDNRKLSFLQSEEGLQLIERYVEQKQVFIEYDPIKGNARLHGSEKNVDHVHKELIEKFSTQTSQYKVISLKGKNILSLLINKLKKWNEISESFSEKLEIIPQFSKKEIRVSGPPDDIALFEKTLELQISNNQGASTQLKGIEGETCGICLGEIAEFFLLELCRHKFCNICLKEMVESATIDASLLPLKCLTCGTFFSLQDIKEITRSESLPRLYKKSLENFLQKNKEKYRFCPSPDCGQILRIVESNNKARKTVNCDVCKRNFCGNCWKTAHPGSNCKNDLNPEVMKQFNLRACPKCKLVIQKIDGCNHMHCKPPHGCDSHLCWVCGEGFKSSGECYSHISKKNHYDLNAVIREADQRDRGRNPMMQGGLIEDWEQMMLQGDIEIENFDNFDNNFDF